MGGQLLIHILFRKELTGKFYRNESQKQLLDNVIQLPLFPCLFLWSHMTFPCKSWYGRHRLESAVVRIQGLIMDSKKDILLIRQTYVFPSVKSHRYYSASQFVTQHAKVKVKF